MSIDKKFAPPEVFASLEEQLDTLDNTGGKKLGYITPEFFDKKSREFTFEDGEKIMRPKRRLWKQTKMHHSNARVEIPTEYPILISPIGDVHWGSLYTDGDRFRRDIDYIADTPGMYMVLMSNMIDNALPAQYPDSMLVAGLNPEEQVASMRSIVKELDKKGKVLGAVQSACHEGWTWKHAGQDINRLLYEGLTFPVLENGGQLSIKLGNVLYRMVLFHQIGPFESNFNKTHALKQMSRMQRRKADILVGAHKHYAEADHDYVGRGSERKDVVFLRTGTYKLDDRWATDRGYTGGEPGGVSVMLYGDKRRMVPFLDIETARGIYRGVLLDQMNRKRG